MTKILSQCCSAAVVVEGGCTKWYTCATCGEACDIEMDPPTQEKCGKCDSIFKNYNPR